MEIINNNIKAFRAEWLKLKGTGIWWIILIGASLMPAISTVASLSYGSGAESFGGSNPWQQNIVRDLSNFIFFYVLICILIVVRLCQTEHRNQGWKLIETQPIHRAHIFMGKFKMAAVLSLLTLLFFVAISITCHYLVAVMQGQKDYLNSTPPIGGILLYVLRVWVASWGLLAFQYVVSLWLTNFAGPFMIGFVMFIVAGIASAAKNADWNPYSSPGMSGENFSPGVTGQWLVHNEVLSIVWMLLFLWLGYQYYYYRSWKDAVLGGRQVLKILVPIAVFALLFYLIETPVAQERYNRTVIAGEVEELDSSITQVTMFHAASMDTLMKIPFKDGHFHGIYDGPPLKSGEYIITAGSNAASVYMGDKDSIHIRWPKPLMMMRSEAEITGTRQAENAMNRKYESRGFNLGNLQNFNPQEFAERVVDQWSTEIKGIDGFKTIENIRPAAAFLTVKKKLASLPYLEKVNFEYPKSFSIYNAGKKLDYPKSLDTLIHYVGINEKDLLGEVTYLDYLDKELRHRGNFRELNYDSSYFDFLVKDDRPVEVRNALLAHGMKGMIVNYGDSLVRNHLFNTYIAFEKDPHLARKLSDRLSLENSLTRGMPAPLFDAESLAGKKLNWTDFKGKYVVVDVWATWCGPCKNEDPFFQRYAEMYSSDKIAFVGVSIDDARDQFTWKYNVEENVKQVVQLRATDKMGFMRKYGIEGIPRYMLIDPEGRFVSTNLPRPSNRLFEDYLKEVAE